MSETHPDEYKRAVAKVVADALVALPLQVYVAQWRPIETAPLAKMVLLWAGGWRHPFPGMRNGEGGQVWVDTGEPTAAGRQAWATHWMPLPEPPGK